MGGKEFSDNSGVGSELEEILLQKRIAMSKIPLLSNFFKSGRISERHKSTLSTGTVVSRSIVESAIMTNIYIKIYWEFKRVCFKFGNPGRVGLNI